MNSLRMECGYRHWGHDISDEDTPLEAGLAFALKLKTDIAFIGRGAMQCDWPEHGIARSLEHHSPPDMAEGESAIFF